MSDLGQYELSERIYRSAPDLTHNKDSGRYSSMASWHTSSTYETPSVSLAKNAAVAAVYGSHSRQLADRYFFLGLTCASSEDNHDREWIYWQNKALSLYQQNHAVSKCIDSIAQLTIANYGLDESETKRLLAEAACLVPSMDEAPYVSTSLLQYIARRAGDKEKTELFQRSFDKYQYREERPFWPDVLLAIFAIFCSGFGCLFAKEHTVLILIQRASQRCFQATHLTDLLESFQRLTALHLVRVDLKAAERNSLSMLAFAEGNFVNAPDPAQPKIANASPTRLATIGRFEFFRLILAVAIAWSFYI